MSDAESVVQELRSALANLRAAAEALEVATPRRSQGRRGDLLRVVIEESVRASDILGRWAAVASDVPGERSVVVVEALGRELARRLRAACDLHLRLSPAPSQSVEVSPELAPALVGALSRLRRDFAVGEVALSVARHGSLIALDFSWPTSPVETALLREAHVDLLGGGSEGGATGATSLREAARASGGEAWIALDRGGEAISLRVLLARGAEAQRGASSSKPSK